MVTTKAGPTNQNGAKVRTTTALIDYTEVPPDGDHWEAFARDFLIEEGFAIDSPPNRGADGGKDLIVTENVRGNVGRYLFRWLVSCKHKAHSRKSVSESDEPNVFERVRSFGCEGFIGVYSTMPSSAFIERLNGLRANREIRDYKIYDGRLIEGQLLRVGNSALILRYMPRSYQRVKPLHAITGKYVPLLCCACERDMLEATAVDGYTGLIGIVSKPLYTSDDDKTHIVDIYWACKGQCDRVLDARFRSNGLRTGWEDISDLANPAWYLRWVFAIMNRLRDQEDIYEGDAYEKMKEFVTAMGQKVFRELSERERHRFDRLMTIPML
jgi:hypothetical protein